MELYVHDMLKKAATIIGKKTKAENVATRIEYMFKETPGRDRN